MQIFKPKSLHITDTEKPFLTEENNVLVRMTAAGICGSDVGICHGINAAATYPGIIGYEMVGIVEETVSSVTSLRPGDRVIVNQVTSCGHCYPCCMGRGNVCDSLAVKDVHIDGRYQEYIVVPQKDCCPLPNSILDTGAVIIEPATIATQSYTRAELGKDGMLPVCGYGALGSSILKIARSLCGYIIVANVIDEKLEGAESAGAAHTINVSKEDLEEKIKEYTHRHGATVFIDAACGNDSLIRLLKAAGNTGQVTIMGFSAFPVEINQFLITSKEPDVRGSHPQSKMSGRAIELIDEGKFDPTGGIFHTFLLLEVQEALDFVGSYDPSTHKVVLTFDS